MKQNSAKHISSEKLLFYRIYIERNTDNRIKKQAVFQETLILWTHRGLPKPFVDMLMLSEW